MLVSFPFLKYLNSGLLDEPFFLPPDSCLANEIIFLFYFTLADVQLRLNRYGGSFDNGRALPAMYRERVLDLSHDGFGNCQIAREIRLSLGFVQKVIDRYNERNTSLRDIRVGFPSPKIDEHVVEYIEVQKLMKPSSYCPNYNRGFYLMA